VGLTALYAGLAIPYALAKPFWHDEIYTILLSRLPSLPDTWRAGLDGVDLSPPLNLWLTRIVHATIGEGRVATRTPALLGFYVAIVAIFAVVRRRAGTAAAAIGVLLLFFTAALRYAAEARSYGLMMGLSAVTFLAWMEAAAGRCRTLYLPLLGLTLAASIWNHYFGILVFVPVVAGELVRLLRDRRLDVGIVATIVCALASAIPLWPLAAAAARQGSSFWSRPAGAGQIVETYGFLLAPMMDRTLWIIAAGSCVLALAAAVLRGRSAMARRVPIHETVALLVGAGLPLVGFMLSRFVTGVAVPRYFLSAIPAIAMALPLFFSRVSSGRQSIELAACGALAAVVLFGAFRSDRPRFRNPVAERAVFDASLRSPSLTVVSSSLQFLQLWFYSPPDLKGRMRYLVDPGEALKRTGSDTIDRGYLALSKWTALPVEPYQDFVNKHPSFRVYEAGSGWLLGTLQDADAVIEEIAHEPGARLYQITSHPSRRSPYPSR
jgi:hypothetical protein